MKRIILKATILLLLCFAPINQAQITFSEIDIYRGDTTYIPFRGDTLIIINSMTSILPPDGYVVLANLDYFGLSYYDILQKHGIRFDTYLQKQIDEIFENERWLEGAKKDLAKLKELRRKTCR